MAVTRIPVAPSVMEWARKSAGLDPADAAKKLGVSPNTLTSWELGDVSPTISQLRKAAKIYGRPLAVLFLPDPPTELGFDALRDFRRAPGTDGSWSPKLHTEFRRALTQREVLLELAELSPDSVAEGRPLPKLDLEGDVEAAGAALREYIGLSIEEQQRARSPGEALNMWIEAVEQAGILVIQTAGIPLEEAHGFSISDWPFPVAALNGSDWPRRRLFTLMHEVAHLSLNLGGLCDLTEPPARSRSAAPDVEHVCNSIAACSLLPRTALLEDSLVRDRPKRHDWPLSDLESLSRKYDISSEAVLLRLISLDRASWDTYWERKRELDELYVDARDAERQKNRASPGGPSYYVMKARDIGHGYASSVLDAYQSNRISSLDVASYLDIRFSQLPSLEAAVR